MTHSAFIQVFLSSSFSCMEPCAAVMALLSMCQVAGRIHTSALLFSLPHNGMLLYLRLVPLLPIVPNTVSLSGRMVMKNCVARDFPAGPVVDSALPMREAWIQSLVGELKSCMPHSVTKTSPPKTTPPPKKNLEQKANTVWLYNGLLYYVYESRCRGKKV